MSAASGDTETFRVGTEFRIMMKSACGSEVCVGLGELSTGVCHSFRVAVTRDLRTRTSRSRVSRAQPRGERWVASGGSPATIEPCRAWEPERREGQHDAPNLGLPPGRRPPGGCPGIAGGRCGGAIEYLGTLEPSGSSGHLVL